MRKLGLLLAVLVSTAQPALAASHSYLKVTPHEVQVGKVVRVHGSVDGGCAPGGGATLYSFAFKGATQEEFAGVPAVLATVHANHKFSIKVRLSPTIKPHRYHVGGRCGGGNFGSATLKVTP
jgi:hypothetical protein